MKKGVGKKHNGKSFTSSSLKEFGDAIQVLDQTTPNGKMEYSRAPPQVIKNPV